eukprot:4974602-Alexandrium_andersonii.AAC.1
MLCQKHACARASSLVPPFRCAGHRRVRARGTPRCQGGFGGAEWPPSDEADSASLGEVSAFIKAAAQM